MHLRYHRRANLTWHIRTEKQSSFPVDLVPVSWICNGLVNFDQAFSACTLETGELAFITRGNVQGQLVTGFTTKNASEAYLPYGCEEHIVNNFEVLSTQYPESLHWIRDHDGNVPKYAVLGGMDGNERLYIGRTCNPLTDGRTWTREHLIMHRCIQGGRRVGKIHPSHNCLYIPYVNREYMFIQYEVLCHKPSPGKLTAMCKWNILKYLKDEGLSTSVISKLPLPEMLKGFLKGDK